jgi:hypothetical protein
MLRKGVATYSWLASSRSRNGTAQYTNASIVQGGSTIIDGLTYDQDTATGDFGGFRISESSQLSEQREPGLSPTEGS